MTDLVKKEIEDFIEDWYYDEDSYQHAFDCGAFLLGFTKYLDTLNKSERSLRDHKNNVSLIGHFYCNYNDEPEKPFVCEDLEGGFFFSSFHFERKVSNSERAVNGYSATWNLLDKYITSKTYLNFIIE
jgi:hypothetical protein